MSLSPDLLPQIVESGSQDGVVLCGRAIGCVATLAKQIGTPRCEALKAALQKAAGDHLKGASMVSVLEPRELSPAMSERSPVGGSL